MEPILLIEIMSPQDFYNTMFECRQYKIIGRDDVENLIGVDSTGSVFYLEKEPVNTRYIASDLEVFHKQLALYKEYGEKSEEDCKMWLPEFRKRIMNLDADAFCDSESFWSVIVEQMEYGLL